MSHIHLTCLREWLNSRRSMKEQENIKTYCWKILECELCKVRFPSKVFPNGVVVTEKQKFTKKQLQVMGHPIDILDYDRPDEDFIVLESVTLQNIKIIHVIQMQNRDLIKIGRGQDAEIRVTDISVSRFHARINKSLSGEYFVKDNRSKFGTLIQVRKPLKILRNLTHYLQMGRTLL